MPEQKRSNEFKTRLYSWTLKIVGLIDSLPKRTSSNVIGKQLMRSGTSIIANFIESKAASSRKDYANFFNHSLKSANESKVWLTMLRDLRLTKKENVDHLLKELDEISKILASSIITLKKKSDVRNL